LLSGIFSDNNTKPNLYELWKDIDRNNNTVYIKRMEPGNVCVRYTYMYNGAGKYTP